ncbi:hypothetical protein GCM10027294_35290 [Marinactinospora endophytica]
MVAALAVVVALVGLAALLTGRDPLGLLRDLAGDGGGPASPASPAPGSSAEAERAADLLAAIPTAEPAPRGDYEREEFGHGWIDTDGNGCSTRNDILARDLDQVRTDEECKVLAGVLDDPYTGDRVEFTSEDPQQVQIDHVVPLSLAWRMGADEWDRERRIEFANDPDNLVAAYGPANREKSDSGPGEWRPHADYQCSYAIAYIDVSHRYDLPLAARDHAALADMLGTC